MEKVSNTINTSIAEINRLIDGSNDILVNFELNNDINSAKADDIVRMFDSNGFSIFEGEKGQSAITFNRNNSDFIGLYNKEGDKEYVEAVERPSIKSNYF